MKNSLTLASSPEFARAWNSYIVTEDEEGINAVQSLACDLLDEISPANTTSDDPKIIDFGCGTATFLKEWYRRKSPFSFYSGFDTNSNLIRECEAHNWDNTRFCTLQVQNSEVLSKALSSVKADIIVAIRLFNYLDDKASESFIEFLVQNFTSTKFVFILPIDSQYKTTPAPRLTSMQRELEFEGITEIHYIRDITQYAKSLHDAGATLVRIKSVDLRGRGENTHAAVYGQF